MTIQECEDLKAKYIHADQALQTQNGHIAKVAEKLQEKMAEVPQANQQAADFFAERIRVRPEQETHRQERAELKQQLTTLYDDRERMKNTPSILYSKLLRCAGTLEEQIQASLPATTAIETSPEGVRWKKLTEVQPPTKPVPMEEMEGIIG